MVYILVHFQSEQEEGHLHHPNEKIKHSSIFEFGCFFSILDTIFIVHDEPGVTLCVTNDTPKLLWNRFRNYKEKSQTNKISRKFVFSKIRDRTRESCNLLILHSCDVTLHECLFYIGVLRSTTTY